MNQSNLEATSFVSGAETTHNHGTLGDRDAFHFGPTGEPRSYRATVVADTTRSAEGERPVGSGGGATNDGPATNVLFDNVIPVLSRVSQREDGVRSYGLCVHAGRGGPNGTSRVVVVRLTDPSDPFLLFQLELLEDDYGAFKQKLELLVDFSGFPNYLVGMLEDIKQGHSPLQASFDVSTGNTGGGVFRVVEKNTFKTVEHISLALIREGDVGQKTYLAERFLQFKSAFLKCDKDRKLENAQFRETIDDLQSANGELREHKQKLQEQLTLLKSESEKSSLETLRQLQENHAQEAARIRADYETRLKESQTQAAEVQRELMGSLRAKEEAVERLRTQVTNLEGAQASLESSLRLAEDKVRLLTAELEQLRDSNSSLRNFKTEASKAMSENELNFVSVTERLRGALDSLKAREEELHSLREHYEKQDSYINMLSLQNEQLHEQQQGSEANLAKAHHIISTQLRSIKDAKERHKVLGVQVRHLQIALEEREKALERAKDELSRATERVSAVELKSSELREQLRHTDEAREKLSEELKYSQAALLHLQRSTTVNGRHWGVFSSAGGGGGLSASSASASAGVYNRSTFSGSFPLRHGSTSATVDGLHDTHRAEGVMPTAGTTSTAPRGGMDGGRSESHSPPASSPDGFGVENGNTAASRVAVTSKASALGPSAMRSSAGITNASTTGRRSATLHAVDYDGEAFAQKTFFTAAKEHSPSTICTDNLTTVEGGRQSAYF